MPCLALYWFIVAKSEYCMIKDLENSVAGKRQQVQMPNVDCHYIIHFNLSYLYRHLVIISLP